ncbi:AAA family ATPase [Azospirillum argentinense]|uniref:AAA family ATPase n=1 Tax=Azospirillum argentinense TaxID=2970906 RepID=A0ABW8V2V2_9PROT
MGASERADDLVYRLEPRRNLDSLVLPKAVAEPLRELLEEQHRRQLLSDYGLAPRHRIMLAGAPGNGKTTLAEALAYELAVPLLIVRYDALIGSFLGETGGRLRRLFDQVRQEPCVLFFDEFDAVGKERGDTHETGEIKRVVSTLLMQVDRIPDYVVVVAASNHPELLDRAVWRRFQLRLELPVPSQRDIVRFLHFLEKRLSLDLGGRINEVAKSLKGLSYAEVEEFALDIRRREILSLPHGKIEDILSERLAQWGGRFQLAREKKNARTTSPSCVPDTDGR